MSAGADAPTKPAAFPYRAISVLVIAVLTAVLLLAARAGYLDRLLGNKYPGALETFALFDEFPKLRYQIGQPGTLIFPNGDRIDRDGRGYLLFGPSDWEKNAQRLKDLNVKPGKDDFPLLITLNSSGFDVSGAPIAIRRGQDGRLLYKMENTPSLVDMALPRRDGSCQVRFIDGTVDTVSEQRWLKTFMGVQAQAPPPDFEKMTDEELQKHGYERLSPEEVDKRLKNGKLKPDQVFPAPRVPPKDK